MKHSWKAPPKLQALSYRVLPSRRRVIHLLDYLGERALNLAETQEYISQKLLSNEPFLVGRPGGTESEGVYFFLHSRLATRRPRRKPYSTWFRKFSTVQAGVTHHSDIDLDDFSGSYVQSILASDVLAYGQFAPGALGIMRTLSDIGRPITHFDSLEPWVCMENNIPPWTLTLEGKKVLVIHPFVQSIARQYGNRQKITGVKEFLPDFSLSLVAPPMTHAGEKSNKGWNEHLQELIGRVVDQDFDVALIGAGAYGLPVGKAIKDSGRQALHLGGITQLLFGVTGNRWASHSQLGKYADDTWTRPSDKERPHGHTSVERGAYW